MTNHPITPPPELVRQWYLGAKAYPPDQIVKGAGWWVTDVATQAARWGADQELEACCEWLDKEIGPVDSCDLRADRRPKPPSLRKQAYDALDTYIYGEPDPKDKERTYNTIRKALEALPND